MVYMITYDLNKEGQNYTKVIEAIKEASDGTWCHYWDSAFLIRSNYQSANDVFEKVKPYLDGNDRFFVVEAKKNYQGWLSKDQWKHIDENIFG